MDAVTQQNAALVQAVDVFRLGDGGGGGRRALQLTH